MLEYDPQQYIDPELYDLAYSWHTEDIPFYVAKAQDKNCVTPDEEL